MKNHLKILCIVMGYAQVALALNVDPNAHVQLEVPGSNGKRLQYQVDKASTEMRIKDGSLCFNFAPKKLILAGGPGQWVIISKDGKTSPLTYGDIVYLRSEERRFNWKITDGGLCSGEPTKVTTAQSVTLSVPTIYLGAKPNGEVTYDRQVPGEHEEWRIMKFGAETASLETVVRSGDKIAFKVVSTDIGTEKYLQREANKLPMRVIKPGTSDAKAGEHEAWEIRV